MWLEVYQVYMLDNRIILSGLWVAVMLVYLLGDVLRIFSEDYNTGKMGEDKKKITKSMWLGISFLMVLPIIMMVFSLILDYQLIRWTNIVLAGFFFLFNLVGLPTYPSAYDKFLLVVSMVFNGMTIWYAWTWII
jgi:hypothetical protein